MSDLPVLQNQFEIRAWTRLTGTGAGRFAGRMRGGTEGVLDEVLSHEGTVHSAVLTALLDAVLREGGLTEETASRIVSKCRATDCLPSVHAADILLRSGDSEAASRILAMSERSQEVLHRSVAAAEICLARGDTEGARENALRAHADYRSCDRAYEILIQTDPAGGWGLKQNIRRVLDGGKPENPSGSGRLQDLYAVYFEWFRGRRSDATDRLINSEYYRSKDPDFLLASARMSVDEKDWHSARMMYSNILDGADNTVLCEAAEANIVGNDPEQALKILLGADRSCPRVMRDLVKAYAAMGDDREMMDSLRAYLDSEFSGLDEHLDAVRMLIGTGRYDDADALLGRLTACWPAEPSVLTLVSVVRMDRGNIPGAVAAANEAVSRDQKDTAARVQRARLFFITDRKDRAEKECERVLRVSPNNRDALVLRKDICVSNGDYKGAMDVCRRILENEPSDTETMMSLSGVLSRLGDSEGALDMFRRAVREDPSKGNAVTVVRSLVESGMYREALHICLELERDCPDDVMLKRLKGNAQYAMGDYMQASVTYAAAAVMDPHDSVLWHSKGMADEARGDMESAEDAYNRAVLLDLREPEYWISKAAVQEKRGDMYGAVESLNRAIELDPSSFYPLVRKAVIFAGASRYTEALHYLDMALAVSPQDADILRLVMRVQTEAGMFREAAETGEVLLGTVSDPNAAADVARCLMKAGDHGKALEVLDGMLLRDNGSVPLLKAKAEVLADSGDTSGALEVCRVLQEARPEDPSVRMFVADIHRTVGDEDSAKTIYTELEDTPEVEVEAASRKAGRSRKAEEDPESLASIASSLLSAGDLKGAMRMIDRALAAGGENAGYMVIKARASLESGDRDGALMMANSALAVEPDNPDAHEVLGLVRRGNGDLKGAIQELEKAVSLGKDDAGTQISLAEAYDRSGNRDRAIECYVSAVDLDPSDLDSRERLATLLISKNRLDEAGVQIAAILKSEPRRVSAIILRADLYRRKGDDAQVTASYDMFRRCPSSGIENTVRMVRVLEDAGHNSEARQLMGGKADVAEVDKSVKRYAEKAMRRAYTTRTALDDPDLLTSLGLEPSVAHQVSDYLQDIREYGHIAPGTDAFARMERLSHDVIIKMGWKDLEHDSQLPLEKVFVNGGFKDADEAKSLVAYVFKVMHMDMGRRSDPRLTEMSMRLPKGMSVYEIMDECNLGVYEAKVVKGQIV